MDKYYEKFMREKEERARHIKALRRQRRIRKAVDSLILVIMFAALTIGIAHEGLMLGWLAAWVTAGLIAIGSIWLLIQ